MLIIVVTVLALFAATAPVEAQASLPEFAVDRLVTASADCSASEDFQGFAFGGGWCRPGGYYEGVAAADCSRAPMATFYFRDVCYWATQLLLAPASCTGPALQLSGTITINGLPWIGCVLPVLQLAPSSTSAATTICIEDQVVQQSDVATSLSVGDTFASTEGNFLITAGAATCTFGCVDGFDMNCDGKLGDYCAVENDRATVAGIRACLADAQSVANAHTTAVAATAVVPPAPNHRGGY